MAKRELISEAIGNIDDRFVEEAFEGAVQGEVELCAPSEKSTEVKKSDRVAIRWRKWLPVTSCACLMVLVLGGLTAFKMAHPWGFRIEKIEGERGASQSLGELAVIPHWEDLTISQQYSSVEWKGMNYDSVSAEIPADRIGELLGEVQATGYDHYADEERHINAKVYSVKKLSEECVLAVQYEGTDTWYGFRCAYYRPETLGQFINDMNMYEDVIFDTVHYSYVNAFGQYVSVQFDDVDDGKVQEYLLSNLHAANVYDQTALHLEPDRILGISVDIPILGIENISLQVCEEGYIKTNILATGKLFYIGEENTTAFVDYVLKECEGYETIYIYEDSGVLDSLFGGEPEVEWLDKLFGGTEEITTQSSQGYNPDGAASPSVGPIATTVPESGGANMTSPSRSAGAEVQ